MPEPDRTRPRPRPAPPRPDTVAYQLPGLPDGLRLARPGARSPPGDGGRHSADLCTTGTSRGPAEPVGRPRAGAELRSRTGQHPVRSAVFGSIGRFRTGERMSRC